MSECPTILPVAFDIRQHRVDVAILTRNLAFPNNDDDPIMVPQRIDHSAVSSYVPFKLARPKLCVCFRKRQYAFRAAMPEASMNE